jgi:uncharacterized delta-60 repeat protein
MKTLLFTFCSVTFCFFAHAQSSYLDSSFGTDGLVFYHTGSETDGSGCLAISIQPDGKILAAGTAAECATVIRCNTDGTIDPTFASSGIFSGSIYSSAGSMAFQRDGKILLEGGSLTFRLNANGTLDNTFGIGGIVTAATGYAGAAVTLQPDGKIVVAGEAGATYPYCERLLANGMPDSSFGINGIVQERNGLGAVGVAILPDTTIVITYLSFDFYFMAARYLPNGIVDTSFNHTGYVKTLVGDSYNYCHAIQAQADGKVILGGSGTFGSQGSNFVLIRYNQNGSLDSSYGNAGIANIDFDNDDDETWAMCMEPDGKIIAAGYATIGGITAFAIARVDTDGRIDSFFGSYGRITTALLAGNDRAYGVAVQQDGKVVAGGNADVGLYPNNYPEFALARYAVPPSAGVLQINNNIQYAVLYPNPSTGALYITGNTNHITKITASDIAGKEMDIGAYPPYREVLTNGLADGVYFFNIYFDNQAASVQKIIVRY